MSSRNPYGSLWSPIVLYGPFRPIWSHMVPYGPVWSPTAPYGPVLSSNVSYGPVWSVLPHMIPYCPKWSHMVLCVCVCLSLHPLGWAHSFMEVPGTPIGASFFEF